MGNANRSRSGPTADASRTVDDKKTTGKNTSVRSSFEEVDAACASATYPRPPDVMVAVKLQYSHKLGRHVTEETLQKLLQSLNSVRAVVYVPLINDALLLYIILYNSPCYRRSVIITGSGVTTTQR